MAYFDIIIVGQGVAGTLLHYELTKRGQTVLVIDQGHKQAASAVASGLINPITGRKYVKSWMFEELYPQARKTYEGLGKLLDQIFIRDHAIVRTLTSIKEENLWYSKSTIPSYEKYFVSDVDDSEYQKLIKDSISFGEVKGGAKIELRNLITSYRQYLSVRDQLLVDKFNYDELQQLKRDKWQYRDYSCGKIVFCEGWQLRQNPFFEKLGREAAKGEVLIVKLKGNVITKSIKRKIFITPLKDDLYWVGSTYEWAFDDAQPTINKKQYLVEALDAMYEGEYEIVDHWAGVRPTTADRRPLLGEHSANRNMFVFNGLGTKGASLAPYWALQMVAYLLDGQVIMPEVDISRHS